MTSATALVLIDLQVGVLVDCDQADVVLARTARLVARARAAGVPVVWVQDYEDFPVGSAEWQLAAPLVAEDGDARVQKLYRDSFAGTDLEEILRRLDVRHLVVAGAQSDFCIRTTTQSAAVRGYDVTLVSDAHTTTDASWDGQTLTAAQIVAHTNMYFAGLEYPGREFTIATHDTVRLGA